MPSITKLSARAVSTALVGLCGILVCAAVLIRVPFAAQPESRYVLRTVMVDAEGRLDEIEERPLPADIIDHVAELYRGLKNQRYRIYEIRVDGTQSLVQDVIV